LLQEPNGVTSQKTAFFIVPAKKSSKLPRGMFHSKDIPNIVQIPYKLEFLWNTIHIGDIHRNQ
jgi:hypothetical protein